jgi:hypothetical protein
MKMEEKFKVRQWSIRGKAKVIIRYYAAKIEPLNRDKMLHCQRKEGSRQGKRKNYFVIFISTRLFKALPSSVSLSATGIDFP